MRKFLLIACLFASALQATLVEVKHFNEIYNYLEPETLVILDLDNTLLMPVQEVGSDQWFYHRVDTYKDKGLTLHEAVERALPEWEAVQNVTEVMTPEVVTPQIIKDLQAHYTVMGLSTRGLSLASRSVHQLETVDIDLSAHTLTKEDVPLLNPRAILFRKGILFTSGTNKGQALFKLLDVVQFKPKQILFINDKATHVKDVELACAAHHVPFIGLRYGYLDDKVKAFRPEIARVQFENFKMILTDREAEQLIKR